MPQANIKEMPKNHYELNAYGVFNLGGFSGIESIHGEDRSLKISAIHFAKLGVPRPVSTISAARKAFQTRHGLTLKTEHETILKPGSKENPHSNLLRVEVNEFAVERPELKVRWTYYQIPNSSLYDVAMDIYIEAWKSAVIHPRQRFSRSEPTKIQVMVPETKIWNVSPYKTTTTTEG